MDTSYIPLIGYTDKFSVHPGQRIGFKVSSHSQQNYRAQLVRVISCDPNPEGPGIIEYPVEHSANGEYESRTQDVALGSYLQVVDCSSINGVGSFTLNAIIWPTTPHLDFQAVIARYDSDLEKGFSLGVNENGAVAIINHTILSTGHMLQARSWYRIWMTYDHQSTRLTVGQQLLSVKVDIEGAVVASAACSALSQTDANLLIGACGSGSSITRHFNGKIEAPSMFSGHREHTDAEDHQLTTLFNFDFSRNISSSTAIDNGPHTLEGQLVNLPMRAMTSSQWDGSVFSWKEKPEHYAAIYFHDDDLYDCEWLTDFFIDIPEDFRSGIYAVRLDSIEGYKDMIPFFVTPRPGEAQSKIAVLIPTFTYTMYANIGRGNTNQAWREKVDAWQAWPWNGDEHMEYGRSTYNRHSDGSGIAYSSRKRPIFTMRSATVCYYDVPGSGLRHFATDAHLWYWLETCGYDFDVITDDDLHFNGVSAISDYSVVMTTCHPEYHTKQSLDAIDEYCQGDGNLMYLGGNGFYWKVALSKEWPQAIEIRRGEGGIRAWASEVGEYYNAFDGSYGGLWRRNGRPPQKLVGVGFTAQGEHRGGGYRRTPDSFRGEYSWIFKGIDEEVIGDFGFSGGGAAGFELDRSDPALGTPPHAVILATSKGDPSHFVLAPEDILNNFDSWNGEPFEHLLRSDIVYFQNPGGGAVFSVGSITFCGSLPFNDTDNNVSRMTKNVLNRFLEG